SIMELREDIETNVLVRIVHHSRHRGNAFFSKRIHDFGNVTRRCRVHSGQPSEIRQNTEARRNILQKLAYAFPSHPCLLGRNPLRTADHQEAFRLIKLNGVHPSYSHAATTVASPNG